MPYALSMQSIEVQFTLFQRRLSQKLHQRFLLLSKSERLESLRATEQKKEERKTSLPPPFNRSLLGRSLTVNAVFSCVCK